MIGGGETTTAVVSVAEFSILLLTVLTHDDVGRCTNLLPVQESITLPYQPDNDVENNCFLVGFLHIIFMTILCTIVFPYFIPAQRAFLYLEDLNNGKLNALKILKTTELTKFDQASALTAKKKSSKCNSDCDDDEITDVLHYVQPDQWTKPTGTHLQVYTVPRFPENHNALLPLKVLRKLDEMSPREYLTYILSELSLEERESLMVDERHRRKTFQVNWPYDNTNTLSGIKMAQAGLYSVDDYDRVQCIFCRGSLHRWERDDVPMLEHAISFAFCRFVKGLSCGNREYRSNMMAGDDLRNITTFQSGRSDPGRRNGTISVDSSSLGISTIRAAHIEYAPDASRLRTFTRWPASSPIDKAVLCQAGFYFTGFDDQVRCFYCSGGLREWRITDDPWEEHARWFPDCAFLLQQKGQDYVDEIHARTPANKKCVRKTEAQKKAEVVKDEIKSSQESMLEICQQLDYTKEQVEQAIEFHGGEFDNIKDMIEVLYRIESGDISHSDRASRMISNPVIAEDDIGRALKLDTTQSIPGEFVRSEQSSRFEQACKNCERKTGSFVPATRISMPCGHLTLCEQCNMDEQSRAPGDNYDPKCVTCHAKLTGTMRIFFA